MHNGRRGRGEDVCKGGMMGSPQPSRRMHCWMTGSVQWAQYQTKVMACSALPFLYLHCVAKIKFLCLCSPTWHIWFHLELLWWFELKMKFVKMVSLWVYWMLIVVSKSVCLLFIFNGDVQVQLWHSWKHCNHYGVLRNAVQKKLL